MAAGGIWPGYPFGHPSTPRRAGGGYDFTAVRSGLKPTRRSVQQIALDEPATEAIFRALKRAANMRQPCPSLGDLARALAAEGLELTRDQVQARIRKLADSGLIRSEVLVEDGVPQRVVTIAATGRRTALPPRWAALERAVKS